MSRVVRTVILVSGGGSNLQAIIDAMLFEEINNCDIAGIISSSKDAYAVTRAENAGLPVYIIERDIFPNNASFCEAILKKLDDLDAQLVVLAGFEYKLSLGIIKKYENKIINVISTLMPAFCGLGYSGQKIQELAIACGVQITGATAYFVTEDDDFGPIILQKAVDVQPDDTPLSLQRRITEKAECEILTKAISMFCSGKLTVCGSKVKRSE